MTLTAVLYDRVSTDDEKQDPRGHLAELRAFADGRGWPVRAEWFDTVSGDPARRGSGDPPGLRRALDDVARLGARGVLVIRSAERLVRSPVELLQLVARVQASGAHVVSRDDGADLDTTSDYGELLLFIKGWLARMALRFTRKMTAEALAQRRREIAARGGFVSRRSGVWRTGLGRPATVTAEQLARAAAAVAAGTPVARAAREAGIGRRTLRRHLAALAQNGGSGAAA